MCLLVSASGTNLLYSLVWTVSKADGAPGSRERQPTSLSRVYNQTFQPSRGFLARGSVRLAVGGAARSRKGRIPAPNPSPASSSLGKKLGGEREQAEKSPREHDPGWVCLGLKGRWPILSPGHFQMIQTQSLQNQQRKQRQRAGARWGFLLPGSPSPGLALTRLPLQQSHTHGAVAGVKK